MRDRNWLVHESIAQGRDYGDLNMIRNVILRTREIIEQAKRIFHEIQEDLMSFSEARGVDMSGVRAAIKKYYTEG